MYLVIVRCFTHMLVSFSSTTSSNFSLLWSLWNCFLPLPLLFISLKFIPYKCNSTGEKTTCITHYKSGIKQILYLMLQGFLLAKNYQKKNRLLNVFHTLGCVENTLDHWKKISMMTYFLLKRKYQSVISFSYDFYADRFTF